MSCGRHDWIDWIHRTWLKTWAQLAQRGGPWRAQRSSPTLQGQPVKICQDMSRCQNSRPRGTRQGMRKEYVYWVYWIRVLKNVNRLNRHWAVASLGFCNSSMFLTFHQFYSNCTDTTIVMKQIHTMSTKQPLLASKIRCARSFLISALASFRPSVWTCLNMFELATCKKCFKGKMWQDVARCRKARCGKVSWFLQLPFLVSCLRLNVGTHQMM